ncbi:hypothetical protein MKX01_003449, partial [Papaver californicum]
GKVVPLYKQIELFATSFFFVNVGSNDIFEYFFLNKNPNKEEFMTGLKPTCKSRLREIWDSEHATDRLCPSKRSLNAGGCLEILNEYSLSFYSTMGQMLIDLSCELKEVKYSFANVYGMVSNIMDNPLPYGFKNITAACCGGGRFIGDSPCIETAKVCWNGSEYLVWDWCHPQAAADLAVVTLCGGPPRFVTPINFRQLAEH